MQSRYGMTILIYVRVTWDKSNPLKSVVKDMVAPPQYRMHFFALKAPQPFFFSLHLVMHFAPLNPNSDSAHIKTAFKHDGEDFLLFFQRSFPLGLWFTPPEGTHQWVLLGRS